MAKGISLFGRKRTVELGNTQRQAEKKDELLALKLQSLNEDAHQAGTLQQIPIDLVLPDPGQPRKIFRQIDSLAASIQQKGIIQPIVVKAKNVDGQYIIIVGERRFQAAKQAGMKTVPCIIRQEDDANTLILQLLENDQRESVSPLEESDALAKLIHDMSVSKAQVAKELGRDPAWVSIRLGLQQASGDIKSLIEEGLVEDVRTLHELRMLEKDHPQQAKRFIGRVRKNQVVGSYRQVIANLRKQQKKAQAPTATAKPRKLYGIEKKGQTLLLDVGAAQPLAFSVTPDVIVQFLANITYD